MEPGRWLYLTYGSVLKWIVGEEKSLWDRFERIGRLNLGRETWQDEAIVMEGLVEICEWFGYLVYISKRIQWRLPSKVYKARAQLQVIKSHQDQHQKNNLNHDRSYMLSPTHLHQPKTWLSTHQNCSRYSQKWSKSLLSHEFRTINTFLTNHLLHLNLKHRWMARQARPAYWVHHLYWGSMRPEKTNCHLGQADLNSPWPASICNQLFLICP